MQLRAGGWPSILVIYVFGLLGSGGFGKMVPLIPDIKGYFNVGSPVAGLVMSIFAIIGATGALAAGSLINRIGDRESLTYGALLSMVANAGAYWSTTIGAMLFFRALDGVTCIAFAVAGPMLLMRTTSGKRRTMALTLWATSISIGFQVGLLSAASVAGGAHWRYVFLGTVAVQFVAFLASWLIPPHVAPERHESIRKGFSILLSMPPMRLAFSFAVLSILQSGIGTIMPLYFRATFHMPFALTAMFSSLATLPGSGGSFIAGYLMNRRLSAGVVGIMGMVVMIVAGSIFMSPNMPWEGAVLGNFIFHFATGWLTALLLTMLPQVRGHHSASSTSGVFNQFSFVGLIIASPLALAILDGFGWIGILGFIAVIGVFIVLLMPIKGRFTDQADDKEAGRVAA